MSRTLFWYIFKDLLRIFVMTSIVLAGIMSFGGLLKPMMQYGLSGTQIGKMLLCFLPATQTYSLPIAALFATTVVYGRLAADSEITACRASGISYTSLTAPALVMGLVLSMVSLACVSFVVPHYMLKVETVAFDSLADIVQKSIQRTHQLKLTDKRHVIYAESAQIQPPPPDSPNDEVATLHGPMFCSYDWDERLRMNVPSEFYTARSATVVIRRTTDDVQFIARLDQGFMFPRQIAGASVAGIGAAEFGPVSIGSPIRENTKFMNITQLKALYQDPTRSRELREHYQSVTRAEQQIAFLDTITMALRAGGQFRFAAGDEAYILAVDPATKIRRQPHGNRFTVFGPDDGPRRIRLHRSLGGDVVATDEARQLTLRAQADPDTRTFSLRFQLDDALISSLDGRAGKTSHTRYFTIPMPDPIAAYADREMRYYLTGGTPHITELREIRRKLPGLQAGIIAEIHARAAFAVSCLILVLIGCGLGMLFRTGNYLYAFAISVIPALLCIALTVTGQHVCENDPRLMKLGLSIVWSGNAIVLVLVASLLLHLRRQ